MIGLLYKAAPHGCKHRFTNPAEAKAPPHEAALALVILLGISTVLVGECLVSNLPVEVWYEVL